MLWLLLLISIIITGLYTCSSKYLSAPERDAAQNSWIACWPYRQDMAIHFAYGTAWSSYTLKSSVCTGSPRGQKEIPCKMLFLIAGFGWLWQDASMKSEDTSILVPLSLQDGSTWLEVTQHHPTSPNTTPHSCFVSWSSLISAKIRRRSCWCICQTLRA